jgi:hypothetical protein
LPQPVRPEEAEVRAAERRDAALRLQAVDLP